jgi:hypothetical protein
MHLQKERPRAKLGIDASSFSCRLQKEVFAAPSPNSGRGSEFKLVVAYDDFGGAACARRFFERLVESFGEFLTFIPRFLKFEELLRPRIGERLAKEAAVADMVVFVANEDGDLPDLVEEWIRTWETTTGIEGRRLLALLSTSHRENDQCTPVQWRLRQAARRAGMKFVLQATPLSKTGCGLVHANPKAGRPVKVRRRTRRDFCDTGGSSENATRCAAAGKTLARLPPTAVSNAIIEVMRSRQRETCPPTIPLANGRWMQSPETKRIRLASNL